MTRSLESYREEINEIDRELVALVGRRLGICRAVADYKREHDIPMMQRGRVADVKKRAADLGEEHDLDRDFTTALYTLIIDEACRIEDEIIDGEPVE